MGAKTKKTKYAGRYGPKAGVRVRKRLNAIESLQRQKQVCPYCAKPGVKREAAGIWHCHKCGATFANQAYILQK